MIHPVKYRVLKDCVIAGTSYAGSTDERGTEVRLEKSVGDPEVVKGNLEVLED